MILKTINCQIYTFFSIFIIYIYVYIFFFCGF